MASVDNGLKIFFGGLPGTGKSSCMYSLPGIESHIFGEGEQETIKNFSGRTDILPPVSFNWWDCLKDEEKDLMVNKDSTEVKISELTELGKYRNISKYRKYLYSIRRDLETGKRPELKSIGLDNLTPFADEFKSYIMVKYKAELYSKEGNFDGRKFWPKYAEELSDTIGFLRSIPLNIAVPCHIQYSLDEENQQKALSPEAQKLQKEWMPNIDGKLRFSLGGLFSYCFYLWAEEQPGKDTEYFAKLEADQNNVGLAKGRFQPFLNPRRIKLPKNNFYNFLVENISKKIAEGNDAKKV